MIKEGVHIRLDCSECSSQKLEDIDLIFNLLDKLPEKVGLKKLMPPYVFRCQESASAEAGISGVVLIAESHISIHAFPGKGHLYIDIFSDQPVDEKFVVDFVLNIFEAKKHDLEVSTLVPDFPCSIRDSLDIINNERKHFIERSRILG